MMFHYVIALLVSFDAATGSDVSLKDLSPSEFSLLDRLIKIGSNACTCLHVWRPVCASNGLTYSNRSCIKCIPFIRVVHDGPCKGSDSHENGDGEVEGESKEIENEDVAENDLGDNEEGEGNFSNVNESK